MEKFNLIVLVIDKHSQMLDDSQNGFIEFKQKYALDNATLVVIFIGEKANRIISGQQISDISTLPQFDDSDGRYDFALAIQSWVYEAQANMYSGSTIKLRTAIFVDVCDDVINKHSISPANILGNLKDTDYFQINRSGEVNVFELITISEISKLESLAKTGDEKALYKLGVAYAKGEGVEKNDTHAQLLLYKSYLRRNIDAIFALVDLCDNPSEHFCKEAAKHRKEKNND
jgi:hypothetical protein